MRSGPFTCVIVTGELIRTILNGKAFPISLSTRQGLAAVWSLEPGEAEANPRGFDTACNVT